MGTGTGAPRTMAVGFFWPIDSRYAQTDQWPLLLPSSYASGRRGPTTIPRSEKGRPGVLRNSNPAHISECCRCRHGTRKRPSQDSMPRLICISEWNTSPGVDGLLSSPGFSQLVVPVSKACPFLMCTKVGGNCAGGPGIGQSDRSPCPPSQNRAAAAVVLARAVRADPCGSLDVVTSEQSLL